MDHVIKKDAGTMETRKTVRLVLMNAVYGIQPIIIAIKKVVGNILINQVVKLFRVHGTQ
jgi:hypothetical protein